MRDPGTMEHLMTPGDDPAWVFISEGCDPLNERSVESRFAISNGFLGVRGTRSTTRGTRWVFPPRTYVAGLFDTPDTEHATPGLVPAADWLQIGILLADGPLLRHPGVVSAHRMALDARRGMVLSEVRHRKGADLSLRVNTLRLVSMSERAIGLQLIRMTVEDGAVDITLEAAFEGVGLGLVTDRLEQDLGLWHTQRSGKRLAIATAPSLRIDGQDLPATALGELKWSWTWRTRPGQVVSFQRLVSIVRSDTLTRDPASNARDKLGRAQQVGGQGVVEAHEAAWARRWHCSDVAVEGDLEAQRAIRFALYHLNSAADPADERISIGARALTGADYHGHVFWDTEIFLLPFYILTWPEAARSLLMYRFHTLDGARAKATRLGWRGALYAWESTDTGAEMTPDQVIGPDRRVVDVLCGKQEQHISSDIAYAVWQYWLATADEGFLLDAGAEILLETGRFWCSRAQPEADGKCHIRGVIGPDEYHEDIDDNAYTNVMARWNIHRALDVAELLRRRWPARWVSLAARIGIDEAELGQWRNVAETMATGLDPETGLFEQFAGYFGLEEVDLTKYTGRTVPMDVVIGRDRTQKTKIVKQADVVALLGLLPEEFVGDMAAENFRYYEPRCSHGSSLSPAMHGLVAARLGDGSTALRFFRQTAAIDLAETQASSDGGIHIAALGGIWLLTVFGFAGLALRDNGLAVDPQLPAGWDSLTFRVQWRGRHLKMKIDQTEHRLHAILEAGEPLTLFVGGQPNQLSSAKALVVPINSRKH